MPKKQQQHMRGFIFGFSLSYSFPVFKYEMGKQKEAYLLSWIRLWPSFSISNVLHGRIHLPRHQESISIDFVSAASASTIQFVAKREKHTKLNVRTTCVSCRHHHAFHSDDATALSSHPRPDSVKKDVKVCEQQKISNPVSSVSSDATSTFLFDTCIEDKVDALRRRMDCINN